MLYLLDDPTGSLSTALHAIPTDIELVEAEDNHIATADQLWYEVRSLHDVGRRRRLDGMGRLRDLGTAARMMAAFQRGRVGRRRWWLSHLDA